MWSCLLLLSHHGIKSIDQNLGTTSLSLFAHHKANDDNDEFLKQLMKQYLGSNPTLPTRNAISRPSKLDLYDDDNDELANLLQLHQDLYHATTTTPSPTFTLHCGAQDALLSRKDVS